MTLWKRVKGSTKIQFKIPSGINVTHADVGLIELLGQAKEIHKQFGEEGLTRFLRESEKKNDLKEGQFNFLGDLILGKGPKKT